MARAEPSGVTKLDADYCRELLPRRDPEGHKFSFGRVVTVCGSLDYAGAAYLAALGAARGGAGLIAMAVPGSLRAIFAGRLPEAIVTALPEAGEGRLDPARAMAQIDAREPDALVIGPGLNESDDYRDLLLRLVGQRGVPAVVDAAALNMLAVSDTWWERGGRDLVLTPHAGEFERLTGAPAGRADSERQAGCVDAAARFRQVVVLKGARTVIADPNGRTALAPFANAALATAGSGDVLAGLIAALLAQKVGPFDAACLGVYLHGRAGERLSLRMGDAGVLASEIAHEIPPTRHELAQHSQ